MLLYRFLLLIVISILPIFKSEREGYCLSEKRRQEKSLAHFLTASILDFSGELESAIKEYRRVLEFDFGSPKVHLNLAISYLKLNRFREAEEELKTAIKLSPEDLEPRIILALLYTSQGKTEDAQIFYQEALEKALKIQPKNIGIYHSLAKIYYQQKNYDSAIQAYKMILEISPEDKEAHLFLGLIYEEKGEREKAIEEFKKALSIDPEFPEALNSLGYLYAEEGINLDEAEVLIKKALEFEPENPAYIDSLGWVYFKKGDLEKAIQLLEKAAQLLSDPVIFDHLGDAYFKKGQIDKAKEFWKKSLDLDPNQEKVKEKLDR